MPESGRRVDPIILFSVRYGYLVNFFVPEGYLGIIGKRMGFPAVKRVIWNKNRSNYHFCLPGVWMLV
jgi:hypothetical protein